MKMSRKERKSYINHTKLDSVIEVINREKQCVLRNKTGCNRKCDACDLVLPDTEIIDAYNTVISILTTLRYER